jgi:hypothetical protein
MRRYRHRQDVANDLRPGVGAALCVRTGRGPWTCRAWVRVPNAGRFYITTGAIVPILLMGRIDTLQLGSPVSETAPCCQCVFESACAFIATAVQMFISKTKSAKREPHR